VSTDSALVARFETVAAAVYEPLQRYLGRRAAPEDAADVLSETLTTVWRRLDAVPTDDPLPWCYGVARRCLANHRRGDRRREQLNARLHVVGARSGGDSTNEADPQLAVERSDPDLAAAIDHLSESEREIVHLWAWERLEPREIAVVLDLSANAVSVALSRAKRKLAAELGDRQDSEGTGQETDGHAVEHGKEAR
jgi:RNA polymerase sigma-70 factor (ECF subfamily)